MATSRRRILAGAGASALLAGLSGFLASRARSASIDRVIEDLRPSGTLPAGAQGDLLARRSLGRTGIEVSERGFGTWGIGGRAYGAVERRSALEALAAAEDLGCNFADTAAVYGDAEDILGEFLVGRRSKWVVATKYSEQEPTIEGALDAQLRRLRTDYVDVYQLHWAPPRDDGLYERLQRLKQAGKARAVGVSLDGARNLSYVLERGDIDVVQLPFSLLDPYPYLDMYERVKESGVGVIVRSSLKEGILTGKFRGGPRVTKENDRRSRFTQEQFDDLVASSERFRFLTSRRESLMSAAVSYALSPQCTSTVILGTKSEGQARENFSRGLTVPLDRGEFEAVLKVQQRLGLLPFRRWATDSLGIALGRTP